MRRVVLLLLSLAASFGAAAQPVSQIIAFGNSWVTMREPRSTNGALQIEYAGSILGVPVTSYGWGGAANGPLGSPATVPNHLEQIGTFIGSLGGAPADPDALYVLWPSAFDLNFQPGRLPTFQERLDLADSQIRQALETLHGAGAERIFVATVTPPRVLPQPPEIVLNARIRALVSEENAELPGARIEVFEAYPRMLDMILNPAAYGFTQPIAQCILDPACASDTTLLDAPASQYVYWDFTHGTARTHQLLGEAMAAQVLGIPEPGTYLLLLAGLAVLGVAARRSTRRRHD